MNEKTRTISHVHAIWRKAYDRRIKRHNDLWGYLRICVDNLFASSGMNKYRKTYSVVFFKNDSWAEYKIYVDGEKLSYSYNIIGSSKDRKSKINKILCNQEMGDKLYYLEHTLRDQLCGFVFNIMKNKVDNKLRETVRDNRYTNVIVIDIDGHKYNILIEPKSDFSTSFKWLGEYKKEIYTL